MSVRYGLLLPWFALAANACSLVSGNLPDSTTTSSAATEASSDDPARAGESSTSSASAAAVAAHVAAVCASPVGATRREQVCHRWVCDGASGAHAATWSGNASTCDAGSVDADAAARALSVINLHRFLADVPAVVAEPAWMPAAQQCALLAHANAELSHDPDHDWRCWSAVGALASSVSLIANRSAPPSIDAYVQDPGNADSMVHRRWLLTEGLTRVAFGSTDHYSCVVVDGDKLGVAATALAAVGAVTNGASATGSMTTPRGWTAWPPAGPVPVDVFGTEEVDTLGWTIQSSTDVLDSTDLVVRVMADGVEKPVDLTHLEGSHGSRSAVSFVPRGWTTTAGTTYDVEVVHGGSVVISYSVEPVACP